MGQGSASEASWPPAMAMTVPRPATPAARARPRPGTRNSARASAAPVPAADASQELPGLLARMANGDEPALADFYERTVAKAYGLAVRIVGVAAQAEEVVADTYHQAWREARRYDAARGAPMAWLLMMCRSRALDALRARDPAMLHEDPASLVEEALQPRGGDPVDLLAACEERATLHGALAQLSPPQRQMVALAFFRGMTHEEIAAHAALPLGTVKSQIRRALDVLRRALAPGAGEAR